MSSLLVVKYSKPVYRYYIQPQCSFLFETEGDNGGGERNTGAAI